MKQVIIETEKNMYRIRLPYSALLSLHAQGLDMISDEGASKIDKDPRNIVTIFKQALTCGEGKQYSDDEILNIFDDVMEHIDGEELSAMIQECIAIKNAQKKMMQGHNKPKK